MASTVKSRKAKARRLQNWVEKKIACLTGLKCGPDEPIEARQMGQTGPDIRLDASARKIFPYTIECKNQETWNLPAAIKQCQANLYKETEWLVVLCKNRMKPVVVLDAEVFFKLLESVLTDHQA